MTNWIFAETEHPMPTIGPIQVQSPEHQQRQLRVLRALGLRTTVVDDDERQRYAALTAQLIDRHPDLAV